MRRFTAKQETEWLAKQERKHAQANQVKTLLRKKGFTEHLSLYGIVRYHPRNIHKYRRIEVIADKQYQETDVSLIYRFFQNFKPEDYYSIWIYRAKPQKLAFVGGWN